jgi:hypothetical protein
MAQLVLKGRRVASDKIDGYFLSLDTVKWNKTGLPSPWEKPESLKRNLKRRLNYDKEKSININCNYSDTIYFL